MLAGAPPRDHLDDAEKGRRHPHLPWLQAPEQQAPRPGRGHDWPEGVHTPQLAAKQYPEQHWDGDVHSVPFPEQLPGIEHFPLAQVPEQHSTPVAHPFPLPKHPPGPHAPKELHFMVQQSLALAHASPSARHVPPLALVLALVLVLALALVLVVVLVLVLPPVLVLVPPPALVLVLVSVPAPPGPAPPPLPADTEAPPAPALVDRLLDAAPFAPPLPAPNRPSSSTPPQAGTAVPAPRTSAQHAAASRAGSDEGPGRVEEAWAMRPQDT